MEWLRISAVAVTAHGARCGKDGIVTEPSAWRVGSSHRAR
jgi:hypothetical protein